jgi:hypothetical protein
MELKRVLAGWNKVCPGCNIARKYPNSFIGKKVRGHWEKGCPAHDAYVEIYGGNEPTSKKAGAKKNAPKKNNSKTNNAKKKNQKQARKKSVKK